MTIDGCTKDLTKVKFETFIKLLSIRTLKDFAVYVNVNSQAVAVPCSIQIGLTTRHLPFRASSLLWMSMTPSSPLSPLLPGRSTLLVISPRSALIRLAPLNRSLRLSRRLDVFELLSTNWNASPPYYQFVYTSPHRPIRCPSRSVKFCTAIYRCVFHVPVMNLLLFNVKITWHI